MDSRQQGLRLQGAGVVHDANQMLAVIAGRVGLLLAREPEPAVRRHLQAIATACSDAGAILRRLQGPQPDVGPGSCRLDQEVHAVLEVVRPRGGAADWEAPRDGAEPGHWSCVVEISEDLHAAVPGQVVREVLANLLTNALEAMPAAGSVRLSARAEAGRVLLAVADSGPGISAAAAERLFQVGLTTKGDPTRGIGLAGSRQLLAEFGADLVLGTPAGSGALFVLDLPRLEEMAANPEPEPGAPARIEGPVREARILVVDDEETVRDMLAEVLGELGCRVTVVPDAAAALAGFQAGAFQIALLDQSLPGMTGAELAKRLRASDPCLSVFLMTGWGNEDVLKTPDPLTVDFTAHKPMEFDRLRNLLDEAAALHARRCLGYGPQSEGRPGEQS